MNDADRLLHIRLLEQAILPAPPAYDVGEVASRAGVDTETIARVWRALGFPTPMPGEPVFTKVDLEILTDVVNLVRSGELEEQLALQMARVMGSSLARIATAQVEAARARRESAAEDGQHKGEPVDQAAEVARSTSMVPMLSRILDSVWRRHLVVAAARRISREEIAEGEDGLTVGFADLEAFTALSQQLPEDELAMVVDRFETLAFEVVVGGGGRVVKTIGDEVMFAAPEVAQGAEIALRLAEAFADDELLGDVRVGLASGRVLEVEGDLYGPAVNLASRIVSIAYPGTVLVSESVHEVLADDPRFLLRPIRPHHLRHIGRVRLWVLRRSDEASDESTLERARARRRRRRELIAERMADRIAERAAETAGEAAERAIRRMLGLPDRVESPD